VFTRAVPFGDNANNPAVLILQGERPDRPTDQAFMEDMWLLMQRCWDGSPDPRPPASEVLGTLEVLICRRLASHALTNPERICLINVIFSDHTWTKVINHVHKDYAQDFLDAVDVVSH
jgi:hypothetical protein